MFDTRKFGGYLSRLRKNADMTQYELANKLNLTHQAISRYEKGQSFPDISTLVLIADIFKITLDELIISGEPTIGESKILESIAIGNNDIVPDSFSDIANLAPILKPSILTKLSENFSNHGIDISSLVDLAEYLNDDTVLSLLEKANYKSVDNELLEKFLPLLDTKSKLKIFEKILCGEIDWHFIEIFLPYAEHLTSQIEAAVIEGALPNEVLKILKHYTWKDNGTKE